MGRRDGAQLGYADLPVGENFEEETLKLFIGPVEFIDEQYGRSVVGDRLQQGAFEQKGLRKNVGLLLFQETPLLLFLHTDLQQLGLVVPLVECRARIESFVTLQADEIRAEDARQDLGNLGLAHACRPFHQQRFAQRAS